MVANIRCGEILNDQLRALREDQAWTSLVQASQQHLVPDFGSQASNLLESCLSGGEHAQCLAPQHSVKTQYSTSVCSHLRSYSNSIEEVVISIDPTWMLRKKCSAA